MATPLRAKKSTTPLAELAEVTPAVAEQWLGQNLNNRRIRKTLVSLYATDMASGNWELTGDAIRFAADGTLLDGQHRLHAIIAADVALPMFVVRGLSKDAQAVMDIGAKRNAGDALRLRGAEGDTKDVAAIARSLIMFDTGQKPSVAATVSFAENYSDELQEAARVMRAISASGIRGGSVWGAAFFLLSEIDRDAALEFMDRLTTGADLVKGSPILLLRNRFMQGMPATARDTSSLRHNLSWVFRAWNHWRDGKTMTLLRVKANDAVPVPR